jgi:hypothetical protein
LFKAIDVGRTVFLTSNKIINENEASVYVLRVYDNVWFDNNQHYEGTVTKETAGFSETMALTYHTIRYHVQHLTFAMSTRTLASNQNFNYF